jgi:hypothetical protein
MTRKHRAFRLTPRSLCRKTRRTSPRFCVRVLRHRTPTESRGFGRIAELSTFATHSPSAAPWVQMALHDMTVGSTPNGIMVNIKTVDHVNHFHAARSIPERRQIRRAASIPARYRSLLMDSGPQDGPGRDRGGWVDRSDLPGTAPRPHARGAAGTVRPVSLGNGNSFR